MEAALEAIVSSLGRHKRLRDRAQRRHAKLARLRLLDARLRNLFVPMAGSLIPDFTAWMGL